MTSLVASTAAAIRASNAAGLGQQRKVQESESDLVIDMPAIANRKLGFAKGLDILVLDDPAYSMGKPLRRELTYLMGGQVRFHEASIDELRERILENAERPISKYDMVAVDLPMIAEFAHHGVIHPLDDVAASSDMNSADFLSAAWRGTNWDGKQYGIPILINPQLLFFREDLFEAKGITPPQNTNQVLSAAKALHDPDSGIYGISWTAGRGAPVGQAFTQFLAAFGQPVFELPHTVGGFQTSHLQDNPPKPQIDTDQGRLAAQFMLELLPYCAPEILSMGWDGQVKLLREGKLAIAYEWASRAAQLSGFAAARKLGFLPHPTGHNDSDSKRATLAPIGGFAFSIPSNISPSRLQIAWNAIEWVSSPQVIKLLVQHGGYVTPRISVSNDKSVKQLSPMISAVDGMARRGQIRLWPRPPVSTYSSVISILGEEIHDMLSGKQSVERALKNSQERADASM